MQEILYVATAKIWYNVNTIDAGIYVCVYIFLICIQDAVSSWFMLSSWEMSIYLKLFYELLVWKWQSLFWIEEFDFFFPPRKNVWFELAHSKWALSL